MPLALLYDPAKTYIDGYEKNTGRGRSIRINSPLTGFIPAPNKTTACLLQDALKQSITTKKNSKHVQP